MLKRCRQGIPVSLEMGVSNDVIPNAWLEEVTLDALTSGWHHLEVSLSHNIALSNLDLLTKFHPSEPAGGRPTPQ